MIKKVLDSKGETTTSEAINIENYSNIALQFIASGISSGNGKFEVYGSADGQNYDVLPLTRTVANSNSQSITRDLSVTLSSDGNELVALDIFRGIAYIKVKVTFTTDGSYSAVISLK